MDVHDLTKGQKRALRAAAELARQRDRTMASEDADQHYLGAQNASLPIVVGGAVANGIISIDDVGQAAREIVADFAARLASVIESYDEQAPEQDREDEYDPAALVSVGAIVDQIDALSDQSVLRVNRRTGEVVVTDGEDFDEDSDDAGWVTLLDRFEIDEYAIMKRFARDARPAASRDLYEALSGRGAFRRFRSVIHERGLQEEWDSYRNERLRDDVKWALQRNDVPFRK